MEIKTKNDLYMCIVREDDVDITDYFDTYNIDIYTIEFYAYT